MLIGELVKRSGLSKDTIRFYEKHGLIAVGRKDRRDNNYKEYSSAMLKRLELIKQLKSFGFTLNECREVLELVEVNAATCDVLSGTIEQKVDLLDQKIKEMLHIRNLLLSGLNSCKGKCNPYGTQENCAIVAG